MGKTKSLTGKKFMFRNIFLLICLAPAFFICLIGHTNEIDLKPKIAKSKSHKRHKLKKASNLGPAYVSTQCSGQMGNQMFYIATALAYAWDNHLIATFPFLNAAGLNRSYNRDHIFFRLNTFSPQTKFITHRELSCHYRPIPPMKNVMLEGNYFSYK
jgi:hypothetical protein